MAPGGNLGGDAPGASAQYTSGSLGWAMSPPAVRNGDLMPSVDGVINIGSKGQVPTNRFPIRRLNSVVANMLRAADVNGNSVDLVFQSPAGAGTGLGISTSGAPMGVIPMGVGGNLYFGYSGGAPPNTDGNNGDFAFRVDTPGVANQRIYVKIAGVWTGIV